MTAMPMTFEEQKKAAKAAAARNGRTPGSDRPPRNRAEKDIRRQELPETPDDNRGESADKSGEQGAGSGVDESYLRLMADFENYKRHAERRIAQAKEQGADDLVRKLAPVIADLEKAASAKGHDAESMRQGVEMVARKLQAVLESMGYERVATLGQKLDPSVHEAVAQIPVAGREPGLIVAETSPGFTRDGKLVLPAKVVVAGRGTQPSDAVRRR